MRRQDLCDLRVGDIHKQRHHTRLRIRGKGGKVRVVPLHPMVQTAINEYLAKNRGPNLKPDDPLFTAAKRGRNRPLSPGTVYYIVRRYVEKAAIKTRGHPHACRATVISHLILNDRAPITAVSEMVGHKSVATTQGYSKRKRSLDRSAAYSVSYE
jgi:integrase